MHEFAIAGVVLGAAVFGTLLGFALQRLLPDAHLGNDSKEIIRLGTGLIATMAALVLGLLVGTANSDFETQETGFQTMATNFVLLDRVLAQYGPPAQPAREQLKLTLNTLIDRIWPPDGGKATGLDSQGITTNGAKLFDAMRALTPSNDAEKALYGQAMQISGELAKTRWLLAQKHSASLPMPFLAVLAFWMFVLFVSFGLFAPRNTTVFAVLLLCALSVSGAVLLIVDLDQPFDGLLQITSDSLRDSQARLGQ